MSDHATKTASKTSALTNDIKSALHGIHGAGEAIRGTSMQALDGVFNKKEGEERNAAIAERGIGEMEGAERSVERGHGEGYGHGHGVVRVREGPGVEHTHREADVGQGSGVHGGHGGAVGGGHSGIGGQGSHFRRSAVPLEGEGADQAGHGAMAASGAARRV